MPSTIEAKCVACDYRSDVLLTGNGRNLVAVCRSCRLIVNPERIRFRFTLPTCPICASCIPDEHVINVGMLRTDPQGTIATDYSCPQCNTGHLAFRDLVHFSIAVTDKYPDVGALVHGTYSGHSVQVPGLYLQRGIVRVANLPNDHTHQRMEFVVSRIERDGELVSVLHLQFIRYLDVDREIRNST